MSIQQGKLHYSNWQCLVQCKHSRDRYYPDGLRRRDTYTKLGTNVRNFHFCYYQKPQYERFWAITCYPYRCMTRTSSLAHGATLAYGRHHSPTGRRRSEAEQPPRRLGGRSRHRTSERALASGAPAHTMPQRQPITDEVCTLLLWGTLDSDICKHAYDNLRQFERRSQL